MKANLLAAGGITLLALLSGYLPLRPGSDFLVRYMFWRLAVAGTATHGSVRTRDADIHFVCYGNGPAVLLPHGRLQILPGGHFTPISHAREVNAAIAIFLDLQSSTGNKRGKF